MANRIIHDVLTLYGKCSGYPNFVELCASHTNGKNLIIAHMEMYEMYRRLESKGVIEPTYINNVSFHDWLQQQQVHPDVEHSQRSITKPTMTMTTTTVSVPRPEECPRDNTNISRGKFNFQQYDKPYMIALGLDQFAEAMKREMLDLEKTNSTIDGIFAPIQLIRGERRSDSNVDCLWLDPQTSYYRTVSNQKPSLHGFYSLIEGRNRYDDQYNPLLLQDFRIFYIQTMQSWPNHTK
jgi:hypothetical protein